MISNYRTYYENTKAERVNGILKGEYLLDNTLENIKQAYRACSHAVKKYNTRRPRLALGYRVPEEVHRVTEKNEKTKK